MDNELQASAVASCFTVAIKTETPIGSLSDPDGGDSVDSAGNKLDYLEPGQIVRLSPGESVEGINPGRPTAGAEPWIALILRGIAVGTGLSYETVARDYSGTSYSSSRTSQLEDRRRFRCWQQYLIRHFLQPTWDAFCDAAALSSLPAFPSSADLLSDRRRAVPVEWQTPEWEWVDPQSEQSAAKDAIENFMSTYQTELGQRGKSWRSVFYQQSKERRLMEQLGLKTLQQQQVDVSAAQSSMAAPSEPTPIGSGEMMGLSTLQFNRNRKAIAKTLDDLANGVIGEATAKVFLSSIGMNDANAQALIDDAKDGSVDTLPAEVPQ